MSVSSGNPDASQQMRVSSASLANGTIGFVSLLILCLVGAWVGQVMVTLVAVLALNILVATEAAAHTEDVVAEATLSDG
ncbi:MAG: hypothetical protein E6Q97_12365 [Desulfurellales bacterium]|nr:MAG: hypothetical protein E6Q97_12365 [Desulfurellales bacterium]